MCLLALQAKNFVIKDPKTLNSNSYVCGRQCFEHVTNDNLLNVHTYGATIMGPDSQEKKNIEAHRVKLLVHLFTPVSEAYSACSQCNAFCNYPPVSCPIMHVYKLQYILVNK